MFLRWLFLNIVVVVSFSPALPRTVTAGQLVVSAAASLTDVFSDLKSDFEKKHPDINVVMNFAASGAIYRQMEYGAPMDVYASANPKWMMAAVDNGYVIKSSHTVFAYNCLVLSVPKANPARIQAVKDLNKSHVRLVAIGTPETVPAGSYAKSALIRMGTWEDLTNKLIYGESVRQVLDYLRRGEVDAGFVYQTDALKAAKRVAVVSKMHPADAVSYLIAIVQNTKRKHDAELFLQFVLSRQGQQVLQKQGFLPLNRE